MEEKVEKGPMNGQGVDSLIERMKAQLPNFQEASVKQYRDFILKNAELFDDVPERRKCNQKAAQLRQEGNRLYLGEKYDGCSRNAEQQHKEDQRIYLGEKYKDALEKYNESICFAEPGSDQLAMGFANRSAVYFDQGDYEFALANIVLARKHNYPEKLLPKLLTREENCVDMLNHGQSKGTVPLPPMNINVAVNPKNPFVADGVTMKIFRDFGRGLVAEKDFRAGAVILDEKPSLITNGLAYGYTYCGYCGSNFNYSLIPCPGCVSYMYCSEECLEKDKRFSHRFECGIADKLRNATYNTTIIGPKLFFFGLALFEDDLQAMMDYCNGESDKGVGNPFELDFSTENLLEQFKALHKGGVFHITVIDFYRRIGSAINYVVFMKHSPLKDLVKTKAQRNFVLNCILDYTRKCGALLLDTRIGTCTVSLFGSICNHSCDPNAAFAIQSGRIRLTLLRPVRKDDQITVTYGTAWWQPNPDYQSTYTCRCIVCTGKKWIVKRYSLPPGSKKEFDLIVSVMRNRHLENPERLEVVQRYMNKYGPYHPHVQYAEALKIHFYMITTLNQFDFQRRDRAKALDVWIVKGAAGLN